MDAEAVTIVTSEDDSKREAVKVFLPRAVIDSDLLKQIQNIASKPTSQHVRIMPDAHVGVGVCIGYTSQLTKYLLPRLIGGDIGCGVLTYELGDAERFPRLTRLHNLQKIDQCLRATVPMGNNIHDTAVVVDQQIQQLCEKSNADAKRFVEAYQQRFGVDMSTKETAYSVAWLRNKCRQIKLPYDAMLRGLGTLGDGNHFIELQVDPQSTPARYHATIHCGSRTFGNKICAYHQAKVAEPPHDDDGKIVDWAEFDRHSRRLKKLHKKNKAELQAKLKELEAKFGVAQGGSGSTVDKAIALGCLEGDLAYDYLFDMIFAQNYAALNRRIILQHILEAVGIDPGEFDERHMVESVHNYIDFRDMIVRKGSIAARHGESCVVALNMRDGVLICRGKGNDDWNQSAAHGAGRVMSRDQAAHSISLAEFQKSMQGIYSSSIVKEVLDESPAAYKDTQMIKSALAPTIDVLHHLTPILNIKDVGGAREQKGASASSQKKKAAHKDKGGKFKHQFNWP